MLTDASGSQYPKFDEKDFIGQKEHLLDSHKELMLLRHQFVAHRGDNINEISLAYLRFNVSSGKIGVSVKRVQRNKPIIENLPKYLELIDFLIALAENRFEAAATKLWRHMIKKYTPEMLSCLVIAAPQKKSPR
jgi:hypothetical protein